jgi:hypothetical protein
MVPGGVFFYGIASEQSCRGTFCNNGKDVLKSSEG